MGPLLLKSKTSEIRSVLGCCECAGEPHSLSIRFRGPEYTASTLVLYQSDAQRNEFVEEEQPSDGTELTMETMRGKHLSYRQSQ